MDKRDDGILQRKRKCTPTLEGYRELPYRDHRNIHISILQMHES